MGDPRSDIIIDGFIGSAIVRCPCGNDRAIIVPMLTGAVIGTACIQCKREFHIERFSYDAKAEESGLRVRVIATAPKTLEKPTLAEELVFGRPRRLM